MAMMACPMCGKQVSDLAPLCPGCGHPLRPPRKCGHGWLLGCGCLLAGFLGILLLAIVGLLIWIGVSLQPLGEEDSAPDKAVTQEADRRDQCQDNLEEIALIKEEWATAHNAKKGAVIPAADLQKIIDAHAKKLICPKDAEQSFTTSYEVGPIGADPQCKCDDEHNKAEEDAK
jgi:hypothetical protein